MSASAEVNLGHVALAAPVLGYVGYSIYSGAQLAQSFGLVLILVALLVVIYHGYLYLSKKGWLGGN